MDWPNELFSFRFVSFGFTTHPPCGFNAERAIGPHSGRLIGQTLRTVGLGRWLISDSRGITHSQNYGGDPRPGENAARTGAAAPRIFRSTARSIFARYILRRPTSTRAPAPRRSE